MYLHSICKFAVVVILSCFAPTTAKSFRGKDDYTRASRQLKSKYVVRTYSASVDTDIPTDPLASSCVTTAISSLVRAWSHVNHQNETTVAYSPPSVSKKGGDWNTLGNWTVPDSGRQLRFVTKCNCFYCYTQCIMSCLLCGGRRMEEDYSSSLLGNVTLTLEPFIRRQLPNLCPEISRITAVHISISDPEFGDSPDAFKNRTWANAHKGTKTKNYINVNATNGNLSAHGK